MLPSNDLHLLIKSLSKAEKRAFKLFAGQHSRQGKNNYILLFDAIDSQSDYNEEKLKHKLKEASFSKKIAATKYLLYDLILKSLRNIYTGKSVDAELNAYLVEIEILFNKALYPQATKWLAKGKRIAKTMAKNKHLLQMLEWEKKLLPYLFPNHYETALLQIFKEIETTTQRIQNEMMYAALYDQICLLQDTKFNVEGEFDHQRLETLMHNPLLGRESHALSFQAKLHYHQVHAVYYQLVGDFFGAFHELEKLMLLWEKQPNRKVAYHSWYKKTIEEMVISGLNAGINTDYPALIVKLRELPILSEQDELRKELLLTTLEFCYYLNTGKLSNCAVLEAYLRPVPEEQFSVLSKPIAINLNFHLSIYYFLQEEYDLSIDYLDKVSEYDKTGMFPALQAFSKLLKLPLHLELQNYSLLEYQLRSTQRYLRKNNSIGDLESLTLKFIKKSLRTVGNAEQKNLLVDFKLALNKLQKTENTMLPVGSKAIEFWLDNKLSSSSKSARISR